MNKIIELSKELKEYIIESFNRNKKELVSYKANEIVTDLDKSIEVGLIERIKRYFPSHSVIGEETGINKTEMSEYVWYIDPIDNTVGFVSGEKEVSTSISLKNKDGHIYSLVIDLENGEIYEAFNGRSYKNGNQITTFQGSLYERTRAVVTCPYVRKENIKKELDILRALFENRIPVRIMGGTALDLCHIAEGRYAADIVLGAHTWDAEAGLHILKNAGGIVKKTGEFSERNCIAFNAAANQQILIEIEDIIKQYVL